MAVMIPDQPIDCHGSPGERVVFEALRGIDSRYYVFHSLRWIRAEGARGRPNQLGQVAPQGEGDFVLFDPQRGILVIEVKSGGIRFEAGRWFQLNLGTGIEYPMQDPEAQANRTRFFLDDHLKTRLPATIACPVYHAVWFPSGEVSRAGLPPHLPSQILLDRASLGNPAEAINEAFCFGSGERRRVSIGSGDVKRILDALAPRLDVAPSMRHSLENRERAFIRFTEEQARVLDYLDEQRTAVVAGAAGTGKTMVALQLARNLADLGEDVLFVCFNAPLRQYLAANHGGLRRSFHTFDSLSVAKVGDFGGDFDKSKAAFLELLTGPDAPVLPNVIIDEGQDFEDEWIAYLEASTSGRFYVFYDRNQLVHRDVLPEWLVSAECRLVLRRNCRMTTQIARFAYRCSPTSISPPSDTVDGPKPFLHQCPNESTALERVQGLLSDLLGERGYLPHEIAILTTASTRGSLLGRFVKIGDFPITDVPKRGAVIFSSVRRFKGLEAKVVILVDLRPIDLADSSSRRLVYVGASRAIHELHVVLHDCDRDGLATAARAVIDGGRKANAHSLAAVLGATWVD